MSKERFTEECEKIEREGVEEMFEYLETTDFFTAPASTTFHGAHEGGLVEHSLAVLDAATDLNNSYQVCDESQLDSIRICALFHDVCKCNFYIRNDEPATDPQINYMLDLCSKAGVTPPKRDQRTKAYISKVIEALKLEKKIPEYKSAYKVDDTFPLGHGEKSLYIVSWHFALSPAEALAIRWHLGGFDPAVAFGYPYGMSQRKAFKDFPLVPMIAMADMAASYLIDKW